MTADYWYCEIHAWDESGKCVPFLVPAAEAKYAKADLADYCRPATEEECRTVEVVTIDNFAASNYGTGVLAQLHRQMDELQEHPVRVALMKFLYICIQNMVEVRRAQKARDDEAVARAYAMFRARIEANLSAMEGIPEAVWAEDVELDKASVIGRYWLTYEQALQGNPVKH
jgi:hypothetical protein